MTKLRALFVAAALLMAACGTATISGSHVKSLSNAGNVRVDAGANAGTDLAAAASDEPGRANPPASKGPGGPSPVQQSLQPATVGAQPSTMGHDRCSDGVGANTAAGSNTGAVGKNPPQPECPVE